MLRCAQTILAASILTLGGAAVAQVSQSAKPVEKPHATIVVSSIGLQPMQNGRYSASIGLMVAGTRPGMQQQLYFNINIPDVRDAEDALNKLHDPIVMFSEDLREGADHIQKHP